jgi:hypothetical protein
LEQYAILLVRVSHGSFFAISGTNKLFVAGGTRTIYETLVKAKVPFPHQMAYFVWGVEFVGEFLLTVRFLSSPACVALLIDKGVVRAASRALVAAKQPAPPVHHSFSQKPFRWMRLSATDADIRPHGCVHRLLQIAEIESPAVDAQPRSEPAVYTAQQRGQA